MTNWADQQVNCSKSDMLHTGVDSLKLANDIEAYFWEVVLEEVQKKR